MERSNSSSIGACTKISFKFAKNAKEKVRVVLGKEARMVSICNTVEHRVLSFNHLVTRVIAVDPSTKLETIIFERAMK
jgi:hypothetical protein